jgi:uncharacterized protein (TIGR03435 family)
MERDVAMGSFSGVRRAICGAATCALFLTPAFCRAQSAAAEKGKSASAAATFDVAVIRPNPGEDTMGSSHSHIWSAPTDGHFKAQNVTALALIQWAFALSENRIDGGPAWMRAKKFDMDAKPDPAVDEQMRALDSSEVRLRKQRMLQALLADRFALKTHEETRILQLYVLVVAKGGPKFKASEKNGTSFNTNNSNGNVQMTVQGSDHTLRLLAEQLGRSLGRVVVDKTGLDGRFDLTLKFVSDDAGSTGPDALSGPSVFTALQEQLGLKLEPEKGPVEMLVIDHIELPSEN